MEQTEIPGPLSLIAESLTLAPRSTQDGSSAAPFSCQVTASQPFASSLQQPPASSHKVGLDRKKQSKHIRLHG
jgi:hypothetical protein